MLLRSTHECEQMNAVYAGLRWASGRQLSTLYKEARLSQCQAIADHDDESDRHCGLFIYQLIWEANRRIEGKSRITSQA